MKTRFFFTVAAIMLFVACTSDNPIDTRPIDHPEDTQEAITNDFTLIKACLGKSQEEIADLMESHGYSIAGETAFRKYKDDITKTVYIHSNKNIELTAGDINFEAQKAIFSQWIKEMHLTDACQNHLVKASYSLSEGADLGIKSYSSYEELLSALSTIAEPANYGMTASFEGNDIYANVYSLILYPYFGKVYMQIRNPRIGEAAEFTESDLRESDLRKDILICKVDYLTYQYRGFYAMNVSGKVDNDSLIPIISQYVAPGDFGSIKLYYNTTKNLLLDGTIIWMGSGVLSFPETFRAGLPETEGLPYPGKSRIALLGDDGVYSVDAGSESSLQHIWQSISHQKEFQHYYENSSKKIAIYLYTPSVGVGNPAEWYYLVYTEQ